MSKHGITENGFTLKRLDEITADIHAKLKEGWGTDTTIDPQSLIGVLVTSFSDELAAVWEVAQDAYFAMYPMSASGVNLDNAMQFGGITRLRKARTIYSLCCEGADGTTIPYGSLVKSTTQPPKQLQCSKQQNISKNNFRKVIIVCTPEVGTYTLMLNDKTYSYSAAEADTEEIILSALNSALSDTALIHSTSYNKETERYELIIEDGNGYSDNSLILSTNLEVTLCTCNILFETLDYGEVVLPNGSISEIVTLLDGWTSVTNDKEPVLGRLDETDAEARQSYIKRIALRSDNMLSSIISAIYNDVQGVEYVTGYENDTNATDSEGRPPHSIEIIVQGGSDSDIADKILEKKVVGITTHGSSKVELVDEYKNTHIISFSRPTKLYVWLKVQLTQLAGSSPPLNYSEIVTAAIAEEAENVAEIGSDFVLQRCLSAIYKNLSGIGYIDIKAFVSEDLSASPDEYTLDTVITNARQIPDFSEDRIEVVLNGA